MLSWMLSVGAGIVSLPARVLVPRGGSVNLPCQTVGAPPLKIVWFKDDHHVLRWVGMTTMCCGGWWGFFLWNSFIFINELNGPISYNDDIDFGFMKQVRNRGCKRWIRNRKFMKKVRNGRFMRMIKQRRQIKKCISWTERLRLEVDYTILGTKCLSGEYI